MLEGLKSLMDQTKIEIPALALLGALTLGIAGYQHESKRAQFFPISFSEYSSMEDEAFSNNENLEPLTEFYAAQNDLVAKILEAYNYSFILPQTADGELQQFAHNLEDANGTQYRRNLNDLLLAVPELALEALGEVDDVAEISNAIRTANNYMESTWHYRRVDHEDSYSCGEDGEDTCWEYSHSTHYYTFYHNEGLNALRQLLFASNTFETPEKISLMMPSEVQEANARVIRESMERRDPETPQTDFEILDRARFFATGSSYYNNINNLIRQWERLSGVGVNSWDTALRTAESTQYNTGSRSDPGPREYRVARQTLGMGHSLVNSGDNVIDGIIFARTQVSQLKSDIDQLIALEGRNSEFSNARGNAKELRDQIIERTTRLYELNVPEGNDVNPFRKMVVIGMTIAGFLGGGLLGLGLDFTWDQMRGSNRTPYYRRHGIYRRY